MMRKYEEKRFWCVMITENAAATAHLAFRPDGSGIQGKAAMKRNITLYESF